MIITKDKRFVLKIYEPNTKNRRNRKSVVRKGDNRYGSRDANELVN